MSELPCANTAVHCDKEARLCVASAKTSALRSDDRNVGSGAVHDAALREAKFFPEDTADKVCICAGELAMVCINVISGD